MGMYDDVKCLFPIADEFKHALGEISERTFQIKSLDCELATYEIREDGTLWHMDGWGEADKTWKQLTDFTGEICFYTTAVERETGDFNSLGWIEFSSYFVKGQLKHLELIQFTPATIVGV